MTDAQFDSCYPLAIAPVDIRALVDGRNTNVAEQKMRGVDFSAGYRVESDMGVWDFRLSGTRLFENSERLLRKLPQVDLLDRVWQQVDLRLRGSASYSAGPLSASLFVNYVDSYKDGRTHYLSGSDQRARVASWTTLDFSARYDLKGMALFQSFHGLELQLTATNILDRDPPYVSHLFGLNFDGVNANPLGRFIAAQLVARW